MRLSNINIRPAGGYRYRVAETGEVFKGVTMDDLRVQLGKHCALHHLPMPTQLMIEEQMCFELGKEAQHWCIDEATGMAGPVPITAPDCAGLSLRSVKQATFTLTHAVFSGRRAEQVEAEHRASVCVECNQNREVPGCRGCAFDALKTMIDSVRNGKTTPYDARLNTCCVCGCLNRVKIWLPLDIVLKHTPVDQMEQLKQKAPKCWMLEPA